MNRETYTPKQKLMALSWKQPYAELMLHGKIETRTWPTKYRGWVLICVCQKRYSSTQISKISTAKQRPGIYDKIFDSDDLNEGKAIAIARLVDCRPMLPADEDKCFVKFSKNLFCHIYEDVKAIEPFEWKGSQGWKEVSEEIKTNIKFI